MAKKEWESQLSEWQKNIFYEDLEKNFIISRLKRIAKKNHKILDQGCGNGRYTLTIYREGFKNIIGMDISDKLLKAASENARSFNFKINFVKGDIRNMPFKANFFDIIISAGIIEHVEETEKSIQEIYRVLKPSGYLLLHVPHKISIFTLSKIIQQKIGIWKVGYEKSFSKKQIVGLLNKYNFKILETFINRYSPGKHKILGRIIQIIDEPLYQIGLGGHHIHIVAKKFESV